MQRIAWFISQFCVTAWVGIGSFFVAVVISLRGSPLFSDDIKLNHPRVLFPLFYGFEFGLLGTAALAAFAAWQLAPVKNRRATLVACLLGLALAIAAVDWYAIYLPLSEMLEATDLPANFRAYHTASRWINTAGLIVAVGAACAALWPVAGNESA
jgi:hypothetical protein